MVDFGVRPYSTPAMAEAMERRKFMKRVAEHYVYALIDPRDNRVRYIGVTMNLVSRYKRHCIKNLDSHGTQEWHEELRSLKLKPLLVVLASGMGFLQMKKVEDLLIDEYNRFHGGLLNRHVVHQWRREREAVSA